MSSTKKCSKCQKPFSLTYFSVNNRRKDGLQSSCKICMAEISRKDYQKHKEKRRRTSATYREKNREKINSKKREDWRSQTPIQRNVVRNKKKIWYKKSQHIAEAQ